MEIKSEQLLALKKKIDEAKTRLSELTGQKQTLMTTLEEEFGCKTIEAAERKLKRFTAEVETLENDLEKSIEELQEKYPQLFEEE